MKLFCKKKAPSKRERLLKSALNDAKQNLLDAYDGFESVNEPDLIDSYIYAMNAANLRYKVILRDYKSLVKNKS